MILSVELLLLLLLCMLSGKASSKCLTSRRRAMTVTTDFSIRSRLGASRGFYTVYTVLTVSGRGVFLHGCVSSFSMLLTLRLLPA